MTLKPFYIWPVHGILILISHAGKPHLKAHVDVSSGASDLNFGPSLHLHPYFVYSSSEGSVSLHISQWRI